MHLMVRMHEYLCAGGGGGRRGGEGVMNLFFIKGLIGLG